MPKRQPNKSKYINIGLVWILTELTLILNGSVCDSDRIFFPYIISLYSPLTLYVYVNFSNKPFAIISSICFCVRGILVTLSLQLTKKY